MHIREASEKDIPGILAVLRASLGETSSKKTETVWRYKHLDNPFGRSLVLIAIEDGAIIGVRAFMQWKWQKGEQVFSAYRAVDTATHPEYQGMGIFKKLTLHALEIAKEKGDDLVFNTPNAQSKPGYLKMGWKEVGRIKTVLIPINPLLWKSTKQENGSGVISLQKETELIPLFHKGQMESKKIFTPKNMDYLQWRYERNPVQDYFVMATDFFYFAAYVKEHSGLRELRISELLVREEKMGAEVRAEIKILALRSKVHFISIAPTLHSIPFRHFVGGFGPVLTIKQIEIQDQLFEELLNRNSWANSLGDLELF